MASFELYLKKKNYGFSITKDIEFEQVRELSTVSECSTATVHSAGSAVGYQKRPASNCQSLPLLLFIVVNSTSLSAALINLTHPGRSRN